MIARLLAVLAATRQPIHHARLVCDVEPVMEPITHPRRPRPPLHDTRLDHGELLAVLWAALADAHPDPEVRGNAVALVMDRVTDGPQGEA